MKTTYFKIMAVVLTANFCLALHASDQNLKSKPQVRQYNPHHFFNSEVLAKGEKQISVLGSAKFGVTERLELGTHGLFLMAGFYNLSLKHLMFKKKDWQTSFTSHTFFITNDTNEIDEDTLEEKKGTSNLWISAFGIVTTSKLRKKTFFSWGLYDLYLANTQSADHLDVQGHFISPTIAVDHQLNKNWYLTATLTYAAYVFFSIESDVGDANIDASLFQSSDLGIDPIVSFLTATYTRGAFNLEFGLLRIPGTFLPYANVFWRFN